MNEPVFRTKYQKYKYKIKIWEKNFKTKYGRIPSKHDIREASNETRHAYKMYYQLKTSMLEDTLNEAIFENDDFDESFSFSQSEMSSQEIESLELQSTSNELVNSFESTASEIMNDINRITKFEAVNTNKLNDKAWGSHLNKQISKKSVSPAKPIKSSINTKLFGNTEFKKRNPRKSISRSSINLSFENLNNNNKSFNNQKEVLPDLETILSQKSEEKSSSKEQILQSDLGKSKSHTTTTSIMSNINEGWLNRCNSLNDIPRNNEDQVITENSSNIEKNYGISNLNLKNVDKIEDGSLANNVGNNTTSFGISGLNLRSKSNMKSTDNFDNSLKVSVENIYGPNVSEDDCDVISNSDDERKSVQRKTRHVMKKRKVLDAIHKNEIKTVEIPIPIEKKNLRQSTKNNIYKDTNSENEEDPFACDGDSDKDPEFKIDAKDVSSSKKSIIKTEKKVKKNLIKKSKTKVVKISQKDRKKVIKTKKTKVINKEEEILEKPSEENDYIPEFGIEAVKIIPRFELNELKNNTELFNKYVVKSSSKIHTTKSLKKTINVPSVKNSDREKLEAKIQAGNLNENFVRVNLRKKVFVRGKKVFNFSRYKKGLWKTKKAESLAGPEMYMGGCDGGVMKCFQCGGAGHFAQQCKAKGENLLPIDAHIEDSPFPTLDEAASMAQNSVFKVYESNNKNISEKPSTATDTDEIPYDILQSEFGDETPEYIGHEIPEDFLKKAEELKMTTINETKIDPIYKLNADGSLIETPVEVFEALKMFGHSKFRSGQEKAVMRILSGQSTLVTLSTGSGKSLCYQLPAYLYRKKKQCITLVISPLVSLMEDQVIGVPDFLNAQCLHTNQTPKVREKTIFMIKSGKLDVLLISPEAVVAGEKSTGFGSILRELPPIAFVCIDEAHCVSQWSHNFRPSYLMISRVLKEKLNVKTILGLTATATLQTRESIVRHLEIPDGLNGVISDIPLPNNLILSVSKDENRDLALINLLRGERFTNCQSIIVYCTRREECERVAVLLRTCLQDNKPNAESNTKKRKRFNWNSEAYHAGMAASRRRTIQNAFMSNELRIVVATVAFGMGINKSDIRAVIHYNMPKTFESYVQEVGRAGRDGKVAHCHLFLDAKGNDQNELRRHIYANSIDRHVIRKLLHKIFIPCSCKINSKISGEGMEPNEESKIIRNCPGHEVCFSIESMVEQLDIPAENISTLLCYLELHRNQYIEVLSRAYTMCKVLSYGGARQLKLAAQTCPPLAMAIALDLKKGISHDESTFIEFPVIEIASSIGWDSGIVKYQLKQLEWVKLNGESKRSTISVNFFDLGFRVRAPGNLQDEELDSALDLLFERVSNQEKAEITQLHYVFESMTSVAFKTYIQCCKLDNLIEPSDKLKDNIRDYFQNDLPKDFNVQNFSDDQITDQEIASDIRTLMSRYPENNFTGRSIARIFHGCQSPNYPAVIWGRCKFWRAYLKVDFNRIVTLANSVIMRR